MGSAEWQIVCAGLACSNFPRVVLSFSPSFFIACTRRIVRAPRIRTMVASMLLRARDAAAIPCASKCEGRARRVRHHGAGDDVVVVAVVADGARAGRPSCPW